MTPRQANGTRKGNATFPPSSNSGSFRRLRVFTVAGTRTERRCARIVLRGLMSLAASSARGGTGTYPTERNWQDPVMQVRIGLWDLASTGDRIRCEYPALFPNKHSEWYVRMAILFSFAVGAGWTRAFLKRHGADLLRLPEEQRWDFLRGKYATLAGTLVQSIFRPENVDEKMALAAKIHAFVPAGW